MVIVKMKKPPNTACTRLVGVGAFSSSFLGSSGFRQNGVISSRPPAGNASRWAAKDSLCKLQW